MKKIITTSLLLLPLLGFAQTEKIQGTYYSNASGDDLNLRMNSDGTFDFIILSGKYESDKNGNVTLSVNKPSFTVEAKERNSGETLKITFKANYQMSDLKYIYVGYEQNGKVEYVNLYDKIPTAITTEITPTKGENGGEEVYELGVFEIPKTENLYLVNAFSSSSLSASLGEKSVLIEKYQVGKDLSSAHVFFNISALYASPSKLIGTYNEANQTLRMNSFYGTNSVVFDKKPLHEKAGMIKLSSVEDVKNWEHLKFFDNPYDYFGEGDSTSVAVETRIKLDIKEQLSEALQAAKKADKPLLVFFQPENTENARKAFDDAIGRYENDLRYYASYELEKYDQFDFYFADKKDEKWFKKKNIKAQNQLVLLDGNGNVIYHEGREVDENQDNLSVGSTFLTTLKGAYLARKMDDVFSDKKATTQQIETLFSKILESEMPLFAYTDQKISKNEKEDNLYDPEYYEYYFNSLKNRENLYKFKATPDEVNRQWAKVVEAHKKDTKLNVAYASLITKNYNLYHYGEYFKKMFNASKKGNTTDLDAIQYLMKYSDEIQKHNNGLSYGNENYQQYIQFYYTSVSSTLNAMAESSPELRGKIREIYQQEQQKNLVTFQDFKTFLELYYPDEFLQSFADYYTKMTSAEPSNLILSLDKMYAESKAQYDDWIFYKLRFSNDCNNAAWKVVENHRNNPDWMQKALKWSKTSLELDAENPYCLDTYAHLLYFTGEKAKALETQRKAVQILDKEKEKYEQGNEDDIREVLKKMENGTL